MIKSTGNMTGEGNLNFLLVEGLMGVYYVKINQI